MSRSLNRSALGLLLSACLLAPTVAAQDGSLLHAMFQDHAVVQRDQPLRVWGHADPGAQVRVSLAGKRASSSARSLSSLTRGCPSCRSREGQLRPRRS